ncbi:MAG: hypothetical protein PHW04_07830 [Candidatus Wallbacteria bacterium]|nr:hypothetical protein [Candidatus Wallbacteria bacterium]
MALLLKLLVVLVLIPFALIAITFLKKPYTEKTPGKVDHLGLLTDWLFRFFR